MGKFLKVVGTIANIFAPNGNGDITAGMYKTDLATGKQIEQLSAINDRLDGGDYVSCPEIIAGIYNCDIGTGALIEELERLSKNLGVEPGRTGDLASTHYNGNVAKGKIEEEYEAINEALRNKYEDESHNHTAYYDRDYSGYDDLHTSYNAVIEAMQRKRAFGVPQEKIDEEIRAFKEEQNAILMERITTGKLSDETLKKLRGEK